MGRILCITGTDTGVGKTFVTALLIRGLRKRGLRVVGVKPIESGCKIDQRGELIAADALQLWDAAGREGSFDEVNYDRFAPAVTPAVAAAEAGCTIDLQAYARRIANRAFDVDLVCVEGAGGVLSPLAGEETFADLAVVCGAPILLIAGSRLGVLNHAALTLEVLRARQLQIAGMIISHCTPEDDAEHADADRRNGPLLASLAHRHAVPVWGAVPNLYELPNDTEEFSKLFHTSPLRAIMDAGERFARG